MHMLRYLGREPRRLAWRSITTVVSNIGQATPFAANTKMGAWYITKYGGISNLVYDQNAPLPVLRNGCDVLVEVHAASVNPLDVEMTKGYGRNVVGAMRNMKNLLGNNLSEFPLILGRDFSGVIRDKGSDVKTFQIGDEVMGVVLAPNQGTHAHYTVASTDLTVKKPLNLTHLEAASLGYAGLTAWSALTCFGGIRPRKFHYRPQWVLIFGGSGGVGSIAIQMLKAWGAKVVAVVSTGGIELVKSLGADDVVDYTDPDWQNQLRKHQGFDLILKSIGHSASGLDIDVLNKWRNARFVTLNSPLLRNVDAFGWPLGILQSAAEFCYDSVRRLCNGQSHRWAYVLPSNEGLQEIATLADNEKLLPVIECVHPMNQTQLAFEKVNAGHARGKTVIDIKNSGQ
ncbi:Reticulon-4-interacting protein 1, mitochondrial [Chamberlinius hualienensis]